MNSTVDPTLQRAIVIVGAPRSGTTLLGELLSCHPTLAYVGEPRLTWRYGNDAKSDMLQPADARPAVCEYIRGSFSKAVHAAGAERLLEKLPSNALRMGFVEQVLPGCLFVHIMRDGVESALSIRGFWQRHSTGLRKKNLLPRMKEIKLRQVPYYAMDVFRRVMPKGFRRVVNPPLWGPRIPGLGDMAREMDLLEVATLQWRTCVEAACDYGRQLPADRYYECRLEDMSPELVKSILEFCELDECDEFWAGYHDRYDPAMTTKRTATADAADLATINRWAGPTLEWLGYRESATQPCATES